MARRTSFMVLRPTSALAYQLSEAEQALVTGVNARRLKHGLPALRVAGRLVKAAQHHARNMASSQTMSHVLPKADLPTLRDRLEFYGYGWSWAGENIAARFEEADEVVRAWMKSAGHRANVLRTQFEDVGAGVVRATNGDAYWCMTFGRRD